MVLCLGFVFIILSSTSFISTLEQHRDYLYASVGVGESMYPTIQNRDYLLVQEKNDPDFALSLGDILVYSRASVNNPIAHRIVDIKGNTYYVRGDNTYHIEQVTENQVIGKIYRIIPRGNIVESSLVNIYFTEMSTSSFTMI